MSAVPRSRPGPAAPRLSEPDLPRVFEEGSSLRPRGDVEGERFAGLTGVVEAAHGSIEACAFVGLDVERLDVTGARLVDAVFDGMRSTEVRGRGSRWRRVRVTGGRIGTLDLAEAEIDEVELRDVRIEYLNLAGATAADVEIVDCTIRAIDLPGAELRRVRFEGTRGDEIDTRELRADDVDLRGLDAADYSSLDGLRGATLRTAQVEGLAVAFARRAGIDVLDD